MDKALIIGSSGGIGAALKSALEAQGASVVGLSRSADGLDLTNACSVHESLARLEGPFNLVIVATGALEIGGARPEKSLSALTSEAMLDQFRLNAVGPALVLREVASLMPRDRKAVFAVLSARVGSIGDNRLGGWYSYRAAKAALNQLIRTASVELARSHRHLACVCLHPGTVETEFTRAYLGRHPAVSATVAAERLLQVIDTLGPGDTGRFLDYAGKEIPW
jgi:NAD(P)-dependent dehydrogenase (short-subunit alcohol dehydrogenase family)